MTFTVNIRWSRLSDMPECQHGRVEGYCACWNAARIEAGTDETAQRVRPVGREPEMPAQKVSNG